MQKRILIPIIFAFLSLLSGCSAAGEPDFSIDTSSAFYKEEQTAFADDFQKLRAGNAAFDYFDFSSEYGVLRDYSVGENGNACFLYKSDKAGAADGASASYVYHIVSYTKESDTYEPLNLDLPSGYLERILLSPQGYIAAAGADTVSLYQPQKADGGETAPHAQIRADSRMGFLFTQDNCIVCMPAPGESYFSYDLNTGKKKYVYLDKKYLSDERSTLYPYLQQTGEIVLLAASAGIYERTEEGWILRVSSERNSMGRSDFYPLGVWPGEQNDYYVKTGQRLYRYYPVEESPETEITLKLKSLVEVPRIRDMIVSYQVEHPGITVEYDFQISALSSDQQELNSALQRINAGIVSADAADLYVLDGLPRRYYQEKGCLLALDGLAGEIIQEENCFENIINACYDEDGIYFLPACYSANLFVYRKELEGAATDIHALAGYLAKHPQAQALPPYTYAGNAGYCVDQMYRSYGQQLYQDGRVTEESIRSFLSSMKTVFDRTNQTKAAVTAEYTARYGRHAEFMPDELWRMDAHREGSISMGPFTGSSYFILFQGVNMEDCTVSLNNYFLPELMFAVHSGTKQEAAAKDFIRYAFRYLHDNPLGSSAYVFRDALTPRIRQTADRVQEKYDTQDNTFPMTHGPENEVYLRHVPTEDDYYAWYVPLLEQLDQIGQEPGPADAVYTVYAPSAAEFLEGTLPLNQAAEQIYSRVSLLESENSEGGSS